MVGVILKATTSSFQKGMTLRRSIYVKKVMELLAFIFEQPSYSEFDETQQAFRLKLMIKAHLSLLFIAKVDCA